MKKIRIAVITLILIVPAINMSCSREFLIPTDGQGDLDVTLDSETLRTAQPGLDNEPASYRISGTHHSGAAFDITTPDTSIHVSDLQIGDWELHVRAYNGSNQIIAQGTGSLSIEPGGSHSISIVLYNALGTGSLNFSLNWNSQLIADESLSVVFSTLGGEALPLDYTIIDGTATGITDGIPSGFYKMEVNLHDGPEVVMGTVEIVLIQEGTVTAVDLDFTQINKPGQMIPVAGPDFTVSWDSDSLSVDEYRVYYREHGTFNWMLLGSTGSGAVLTFTVDQSMLPFGTYDLAVSSVAGGAESELHTSMDDTAVPATGWYIDWN